MCVIAPIAEEFFFRGFFFGALRKWTDRDRWPRHRNLAGGDHHRPAVRARPHGFGPASQYLIPLGFLGFVLCIVRWKTRSLYPCIALHSANNALALGVNQLSWNAIEILGLVLASWLVVGSLTLPLAARAPRAA